MESDAKKIHKNRRGTSRLVTRVTSVVLSLMLTLSLFSVGFDVGAVETINSPTEKTTVIEATEKSDEQPTVADTTKATGKKVDKVEKVVETTTTSTVGKKAKVKTKAEIKKLLANDDKTYIVTFHVNNSALNGNDTFITKKTNSNGKIAYFSETPQIDNYIFKGWYHSKNNDSQPVDFDNDTYNENSDIYARWISVGTTSTDNQDNEVNGSTVGGFDVLGVQKRDEMYDENYNEIKPAGMRFVASLKNDVLSSLDSLSDKTLTSSDGNNNRVEYGFLLTKKSNINNWINYAGDKISNYEMQYNGTDVNGTDTTVANTANYQGFITNVDCTASDYSTRQIKDHKKYSNYRLFTVVVTYSDNDDTDKQQSISSRAYIRYIDANGHTKIYYDDYDGTNTYGGCSVSYNDIPDDEEDGYVYYSSLALCAGDVNNLNNDNADVARDDLEHAVCAMKVDGSKCYVDLMQDTTINANIPFENECDINLNNHTITGTSSANLRFKSKVRMHDGNIYYNNLTGYGVQSSGSTLEIKNVDFDGTINSYGLVLGTTALTKVDIKNCDFNIDIVSSTNKSCVIRTSQATNMELNVEDCDFNVKASTQSKISAVMYLSSVQNKKNTIKNCNIEFESKDEGNEFIGMYLSTNTDIINCDIEYNDNSATPSSNGNIDQCVRLISAANCLFKNSQMTYNRNVDDTKHSIAVALAGSGTFDVNNSNITTNNQESVSDLCVILANGTSTLRVHNNSNILMNDNTLTGTNYAIQMQTNSTGIFDYCSIYVPLKANEEDGSWIGNALTMVGNTTATFSENEGPVKVHGGNTGINTQDDSVLNIYGGKFCSPTHGGGYLGGKTNIYGGTFYNSFDAGEEPADLATIYPNLIAQSNTYGGCYISHTADVRAQNARFIGGRFGMRARANGSGTNNPQAVLTDCYVEGTESALSVWCGSITVAGSTVCVPEINADGTSIIDNRTP